MGEQINPETIERLGDAPAAIRVLLNTVEELLQPNQALRDEVQEWKDEVNRLKGAQGKRSIKPSDAEFKGYVEVVVQDIIMTPTTPVFRKEKYYALSTSQSYVEGELGSGMRGLISALYHRPGMREPKISEF